MSRQADKKDGTSPVYYQLTLYQGVLADTFNHRKDSIFDTTCHLQCKKIPFGLHFAPATFHRGTDKTLRPLQKYTSDYLNDFVIFSTDRESHLNHVQAVLDSLNKEGFSVNPEKCATVMKETGYQGQGFGEASNKQGKGYSDLALPHHKETDLSIPGHSWILELICLQLQHYCCATD